MRRILTVAAAVAALTLPVPVAAQEGPRLTYATGFTVENAAPMGLAAALGVELPTFTDRVDLRVEGLFQQARYRDLFVMGSLKVAPLPSRPAFYGIAGAGTYLDGGARFAWSAGAGVDLGRLMRIPLFVEYRAFFARDQFSSLSVGVSF